MSIYLKIKAKSLTTESKIIRKEEKKMLNYARYCDRTNGKASDADQARDVFFALQSHRKFDVRKESRSTYLAYGFLRGTPYRKIEATTPKSKPDWGKVEAMVKKYGVGDRRVLMQKLEEWTQAEAA